MFIFHFMSLNLYIRSEKKAKGKVYAIQRLVAARGDLVEVIPSLVLKKSLIQ